MSANLQKLHQQLSDIAAGIGELRDRIDDIERETTGDHQALAAAKQTQEALMTGLNVAIEALRANRGGK